MRSVHTESVSEVILREYARVLRYSHLRKLHRLTDTELTEIDASFEEFSEVVTPLATPTVIKQDPSDNHFLAAADAGGEAGGVDCIVSGDTHLRAIGTDKDIPILSPAAFLARFFPV